MSYLSLTDLSKSFGDLVVLDDISIEVEGGETLVLLGPSGSGKTTLLRILAGFETADRGHVRVGGEDLIDLPPARRNFGLVFQHYALFPHMTVGENVAFGLASRSVAKSEIGERVAQALTLVDLAGFEGRRIDQISGGQQQRVALARALAPEPRVLLLDEPLSNLDPGLRERTRGELTDTLRRIGITAVWVTHEQEEAFDVGDRVALLRDGRLEQVGPPEELYREPASPFVAAFVGRASMLTGQAAADGHVLLPAGGGDPVSWPAAFAEPLAEGAPVRLVSRPEGLQLVPPVAAGALGGRVVHRRFGGADTFVTVELDTGGRLEVAAEAAVGDRVGVEPRADGLAARAFPEADD